MKKTGKNGKAAAFDAESWAECRRRIEEEYTPGRQISTTTHTCEDGVLKSETIIVHKHRSNGRTIVLTAVVFLLIGALIASGVVFAGLLSRGTLLLGEHSPSLTPSPQPGSPNNGSSVSLIADGRLTEIYDRSVTGVVLVKNYDSEKITSSHLTGIGAGFFYTDDGFILTNEHVVRDAVTIIVELYDGTTYEAELIGRDSMTDIAVLRIEGSGFNALPIGDSAGVKVGQFVMTIGHPPGQELDFTATFGIVGSVDRNVNVNGIVNSYIQIDAAINPGNSGGPLFDMNGYVIGINSAKTVAAGYDDDGKPISADGLGFALPMNRVMEVANGIVKNGTSGQPGIGLSVITIEPERAEQYGIPQGVLVYKVVRDGPCHKAGLYADDIITKVDGTAITTSDEFVAIVRAHSIGDSLEIEFFRDGEIKTCTVVIGDFTEIGDEVLDGVYGGAKYGFN